MSKRASLFFVFLALATGAVTAAGQVEGPTVETLPNGLTVVIQEDHSAPVVAIQYWVKAGSRTESDREAGITHLIEHMIFKGTPSRPVGEVARAIEAVGGVINAYTSFDYTVYHVTIASRYARLGLEVLTDAVRNPLFDPKELELEKKVVLEEIQSGEDRPAVRLHRRLFAEAYKVHPYRRPIIGFPQTVSSFTREDLVDYVRRLYVPQNVVLVVTGDVEPGAILEDVRRLLGDWSGAPPGAPEAAPEPPQEGIRTLLTREEAKEAHILLAFPIPEVTHEDVPAIDLLAMILGDGESARLERKVRAERGLVYSVGASSFTPLGPGLFLIQATLDPQRLREALLAILEEAYRLSGETVPHGELDKARLNVEADLIRAKETMEGKARVMGEFQVLCGDLRREQVYLDQIRRVSPTDIQRVASRYLRPERLTAGVLLPAGSPVEISSSELGHLAQDAFWARPGGLPQGRETPRGEVRKEVLGNGLTVLVRESHDTPTVSIRAVFLGGTRYETPDRAGIGAFLARMLTRGTEGRSAEQLARDVESLAGSLDGFSGRNSMGIKAEFLSRFFPQAMELLSDVLLHPSFDPGEMEKERALTLAALRREEDEPSSLAFRLFAETLYRVHPYGLRRLGTEESLRGIRTEDLQRVHKELIQPDNAVLAIVGDVSVGEAMRWTRRYLGRWGGSGFRPPPVPQEPPLQEIRVARHALPKRQTHIVLGFPGTTLGSADHFPLEVLDAVLSGQGGRLFRELRDRQGLAYSVTSFSHLGLDPGYFGTYIATSPENVEVAIQGLKTELERVAREGISAEELDRAKRYIIGTYEIGQQTHAAQAMTMGLDERYGLGFAFGERFLQKIEEVTMEDVLHVARKYIRMDSYVMAVVGPDAGVAARSSSLTPQRLFDSLKKPLNTSIRVLNGLIDPPPFLKDANPGPESE